MLSIANAATRPRQLWMLVVLHNMVVDDLFFLNDVVGHVDDHDDHDVDVGFLLAVLQLLLRQMFQLLLDLLLLLVRKKAIECFE
jgi:hypothetical protein